MTTAIKERPILFSGAMVRAILEGRKTMTRRVIKPQPPKEARGAEFVVGNSVWFYNRPNRNGKHNGGMRVAGAQSPYAPGDRLWVRETWGVGCRPDPRYGAIDGLEFRAEQAYIEDDPNELLTLYPFKEYGGPFDPPDDFEPDAYMGNGWRPSIHMPRWASRITLGVVSVRVERVQEISERDAIAEGVDLIDEDDNGHVFWRDYGSPPPRLSWPTARESFTSLWDSINLKRGYGWESNPWVWVVEFKRVEGDQ